MPAEVDFEEFEAWYNSKDEEEQEKLAAGIEAEPEPESAPAPKLVVSLMTGLEFRVATRRRSVGAFASVFVSSRY